MARDKFDHQKWEKEHKDHIAEYVGNIDALYGIAAVELLQLGAKYDYNPEQGKLFSFSSSKQSSENTNAILTNFKSQLYGIITGGIASEWAFANTKNDEWVRSLTDSPKKAYLQHNQQALEAFRRQKFYGHTLSDRVWKYTTQFKEQIELTLSVGLSEGRSAARMSQDVRQYLNEPDRLFRRVRDKFGNLVLSKNAQTYHPGQGVYRSSYQNAIRMTRTVINTAYRESDYIRWQQFDFVVGIDIKTSKSHATWLAKYWYPRFKKGRAPLEICDRMEGRYPKTFKFIGWHPNCRCYAVPILANEETNKDWWEKPENEVKDMPSGYNDWLNENEDRILDAAKRGKLPYWIKENKKYVNVLQKQGG